MVRECPTRDDEKLDDDLEHPLNIKWADTHVSEAGLLESGGVVAATAIHHSMVKLIYGVLVYSIIMVYGKKLVQYRTIPYLLK